MLVRARSVGEAVHALVERPGATVLSGGTEVMVAVEEGRARPEHLVSLRRVPGLRGVAHQAGTVVIGALTTYTDLETAAVPAVLRAMAPTVGSPASRNAGTLGGALGTASGVGDAVTALLALDAVVLVTGAAGERRVPIASWLDRTDRLAGDVVTGVEVAADSGSQHYLKPGKRQAVSYATVSCALVVDEGSVRCALGSVGPLPWRARDAEDFASGVAAVGPAESAEFGRLVREHLPEPMPGLRVSSAHRRHVAGVLASRALARAAA